MCADKFRFSVVIPTYNRWHLLPSALRSVQEQDWPDVEIIVVDDHSTQPVPCTITLLFPRVRYLRQPENLGPGLARNRGLQEAGNPWVVMLDDDDRLLPGALSLIARSISGQFPETNYPVFQFSHESGRLQQEFQFVSIKDYTQGRIHGDFVPVIHRDTFTAMQLRYPDLRIGGEHLLWWRLSQESTIPTWRQKVAGLGHTPRMQLTSWRNQIKRAAEYAEMQERCLVDFGAYLHENAPALLDKKIVGAATYWLLCGRRDKACVHIRSLIPRRKLLSSAIWAMSLIPAPLVRMSFGAYRTVASR